MSLQKIDFLLPPDFFQSNRNIKDKRRQA